MAFGHSPTSAPTSLTSRATSTGLEPTKPLSPNHSGMGSSSSSAAFSARTMIRRPAFTWPIHWVIFGPEPGVRKYTIGLYIEPSVLAYFFANLSASATPPSGFKFSGLIPISLPATRTA